MQEHTRNQSSSKFVYSRRGNHVVQAISDDQSCNAIPAGPSSSSCSSEATTSGSILVVRRPSSSARGQVVQAATPAPRHTGNAAPPASTLRARSTVSSRNSVARAGPDDSTVDLGDGHTRTSARIAYRAQNPRYSDVQECPLGSNPIVHGARVSSPQAVNYDPLQIPSPRASCPQAINYNPLQIQSPTQCVPPNAAKGRRSARLRAVFAHPDASLLTLPRTPTNPNTSSGAKNPKYSDAQECPVGTNPITHGASVSSTQAINFVPFQIHSSAHSVPPNPAKGSRSARPAALVAQPDPTLLPRTKPSASSGAKKLKSVVQEYPVGSNPVVQDARLSSTQAINHSPLQIRSPTTQFVPPNPAVGSRRTRPVARAAQPGASILNVPRPPTKPKAELAAKNSAKHCLLPPKLTSSTSERDKLMKSSLSSFTGYIASAASNIFRGQPPPIRPIGERCQLCKLDLAFVPNVSTTSNSYDPPVHAVLPCGHCHHDSCLVDVFGSHVPSQTPSCIACLGSTKQEH